MQQAPRQLERHVHVGAREEHGELVAADAIELVPGSRHREHGGGHGLEHLVAGGVALVVVDDLEVVEVDEDEREGLAELLAGLQPLPQPLLEGALVPQAREAVAARVFVRLAVEHLEA